MADEDRPGEGADVTFQLAVPDDLEAGQFADFLAVWAGPHSFTLDFAVLGRGQPNEQGGASVPARVVARIKIPHSLAPDILKALASHVTKFESVAGPIRTMGDDQPTYPPEDLQ